MANVVLPTPGFPAQEVKAIGGKSTLKDFVETRNSRRTFFRTRFHMDL